MPRPLGDLLIESILPSSGVLCGDGDVTADRKYWERNVVFRDLGNWERNDSYKNIDCIIFML